MKKRWVIVLCLLIALCASAAAEEIAVRVGEQTFSTEEIQTYMDKVGKSAGTSFGMFIADDGASSGEEFLNDAAEYFVTMGVVMQKLADLGLDSISEAEENDLRRYARETYEQIWQEMLARVQEAYPELEDAETAVTETVEDAGYAMDDIYQQGLISLRNQRLIDVYCKDITLEDGEAEAYYEEKIVKPDRDKYESDVPRFEQEVLFAGGSSAYVPEGYFYIKYIVLEPDADASEAVFAAQETLAACEADCAAAREELTDAAVEGDVPEELRKRYQALAEAQEKARAALEEKLCAAEEVYAPVADLVQREVNEGTPFEELIEKHSVLQDMVEADDPGFAFHPDSQIWDERLAEAVEKLEKYGDCTPPVYALDSVYIVCRMDDMRCGAYAPAEETMQGFGEDILYAKQLEALGELIEEWRQEMEVEVDLSGLRVPED